MSVYLSLFAFCPHMLSGGRLEITSQNTMLAIPQDYRILSQFGGMEARFPEYPKSTIRALELGKPVWMYVDNKLHEANLIDCPWTYCLAGELSNLEQVEGSYNQHVDAVKAYAEALETTTPMLLHWS